MSGYAERKWRRRDEAQRHPGAHRGVHCDAVPGLDGIKARAERVDQLNMARRGLRASDAEAHLGIRHSRDQPGGLLVAAYAVPDRIQRFRLITHETYLARYSKQSG